MIYNTSYFSKGQIPHPLMTDDNGFVEWLDMTDVDMLLECYKFGLFPWENISKSGAFFFPKKRYVIEPSKIKVPKSIRSYFNKAKFELSLDQAFTEVMLSCKHVKRRDSQSTWISDIFIGTYQKLHEMGYAHSVEVWQGNYLVGGLYGVSIGKVFTGESMFSSVSNGSRFALITLAMLLQKYDFKYIDCQIINPYLATFGGYEIEAEAFFQIMKDNYFEESIVGNWGEKLT